MPLYEVAFNRRVETVEKVTRYIEADDPNAAREVARRIAGATCAAMDDGAEPDDIEVMSDTSGGWYLGAQLMWPHNGPEPEPSLILKPEED